MQLRLTELTNRIVSASASLIAVAALGTAVYEARLMREQSKATVWPYLLSGNAGNNGYARIVQNVGLGPALIRAFEVRVDGKPMQNWHQVADAMGVKLSWQGYLSTTFRPGIVVPINGMVELMKLASPEDERLFRSKLDHLDVWMCYCSLYGDCWTVGGDDLEPKDVKVCTDVPERRFKE